MRNRPIEGDFSYFIAALFHTPKKRSRLHSIIIHSLQLIPITAPHSPKITAKNLPNNRITIKVMPTNRGAAAKTRRPASDRLIFTRLIIHPPVMKRHRNQLPSQKTILFLTPQYYATPPK